MDLIIGNRHVSPASIRLIDGGVEAVLAGEALISLLDAAFHGRGTIEVLGGGLDRRRLDLTGIDMRGGETRVTLTCTGPAPLLV